MIDEQARCGNPACGKGLVLIAGHRRRQYCDDACKMAAHRARIAVENQARYEALQLELARQEREELRQRWGDLLPASLDLLRHLRTISGIVVADQVAAALKAERDEGRKSLVEERAALIDEIMLAGEQVDFPAIATETFNLPPDVFAWSAFCGDASIEDLRLAREAAHLKVLAKKGRLRLAQQRVRLTFLQTFGKASVELRQIVSLFPLSTHSLQKRESHPRANVTTRSITIG